MAQKLKQYQDVIDECIKQTTQYEIDLRGDVHDAASMKKSTDALKRILKGLDHLGDIVKDAKLLTHAFIGKEMERQSKCRVNIGRSDALQLKDDSGVYSINSEALVAQSTDSHIDAHENPSRRNAIIIEGPWNIHPSEDNMND